MPHASALFCGVLVQSVLGATHATLLEAGGCPQVRIAELDRRRVVDARHDGGVLVVLTSRAGRFDRWVFRFDRARRSYDHHRVRDVTPIGAVFVTTDRGTCALRSADGVQVFSAAPGPWDVRRVDLHADAGAFLQHEGSVVCVTGRAVDRLRYRPKSA
jgi:hypothetical protein